MSDMKEITAGVFLEQPQQSPEQFLPSGSVTSDMLSSDVANFIMDQFVGVVFSYAGTDVPFRSVECDGSVVSQTGTYAKLYAKVGSTWNTGGEGAGNFRLPAIQGRTVVGAGTGSGLTNRVFGTIFGEETHLLTGAESGTSAHTHPLSDPGHAHTFPIMNSISNANTPYTGTGGQVGTATTSSNTTGISISASTAASASSAHNNMQPSVALKMYIRY